MPAASGYKLSWLISRFATSPSGEPYTLGMEVAFPFEDKVVRRRCGN